MAERKKLKVYLEKAGFRCPQIMTPQTFLENLTLGKRK